MVSRERKKNSVDPPNPFDSNSEALNPRPAIPSTIPKKPRNPRRPHRPLGGSTKPTSAPPDYENQSVNVLEQYTVNNSKETTNNSNDRLKIAEAIKEDATRTLVTPHQQGEQIHRTHQQAADMDHDLSRSEKLLNSLEGLFSKPWKAKKIREIKGPEITKDRTTTEVMHEGKHCPSSFLTGQALGGHMRSHAPKCPSGKKRKSVQNEDLLGPCLNEIKKAAHCLMLLSRKECSNLGLENNSKIISDFDNSKKDDTNVGRKKLKLGDGKDDTKVKSFKKGTTPKKSTVKSLNAQGEYECSICHKTFASFQALGGHKASHGKEKRTSRK